MGKFKDLTGQRFGRLLVIEFIEIKNNNSFWKCKCDCGNMKIIGRSSLGRSTNSCGCLRQECSRQRGKDNKGKRGLSFGESSKNKLFDKYKRGAKNRNLDFELTIEQFERLTKKNCYYCGIEPHHRTKDKGAKGYYVYNGIDRVDNDKGYILDNCVPCCEVCNRAKLTMTIEEFLIWINRVYNYQNRFDLPISIDYEIGDGTATWYQESLKRC